MTLADQPQDTWANTILWRLASALGFIPEGGTVTVDPDEVVEAAVRDIEEYRRMTGVPIPQAPPAAP